MIFSFRKLNPQDKALLSFLKSAFRISTRKFPLYHQALRHASAAEELYPGIKNSNERLEFLGDAILDSILAHYLFDHYPDKTEGEMTKMKSKVVRRENLNRIGDSIGIRQLLQAELGRQDLHESMLGNALEALVGAIYLDKGYNSTRSTVLSFLIRHQLTETLHDEIDNKSKLHEWAQKHKRSLTFPVVDHRQDHGGSLYTIHAVVEEIVEGIGQGPSKKSAEQMAAKQACEKLMI
jgi:ribonuclease-3